MSVIGGKGPGQANRQNPHTTHTYSGIPANGPVKAKAELHSWQDCVSFFERHAKPGTKAAKLGPNLLLVAGANSHLEFSIRLYETDILTYYHDGTFSVDNGGWNTPTTISRLNQFAPKRIDGRVWMFNHKARKLCANGREVKPTERIKINP